MSKYKNAQAVQAALDNDAKEVRKMITYYNGLADMLCENGDADGSALVREMAADLTAALAKGRRVKLLIEGVEVTPLGGGK